MEAKEQALMENYSSMLSDKTHVQYFLHTSVSFTW